MRRRGPTDDVVGDHAGGEQVGLRSLVELILIMGDEVGSKWVGFRAAAVVAPFIIWILYRSSQVKYSYLERG
jgi:hypothetical protein